MARIILVRAAGLCFGGALMFGTLAALQQPSSAQITQKCWREICIRNPDTGKDYCTREEITCPAET